MPKLVSKKYELDEIDKKIITLLQNKPSLTHTQIAKKINKSQPTVGIRIKKLENKGILKFQPGANFKKVDLILATVELDTKSPSNVLDMVRFCPFMLNGFQLTGDHNIFILLVSSELERLNNIVDYHFRNNPEVKFVSMEIVTDIAKDFIFPLDLESDKLNPTKINGCGEKCTYKNRARSWTT